MRSDRFRLAPAWRGVWVFAAVALLWGLMAMPWLSGEVTIPYDAKAHFQAQLQFLANALHRGDSPFWTPNVFAGSPQIADPQSLIFSPAFLLALFDAAPSFRAMDAYVLGLLLVGALALVQHGRELRWHPAAQIVAALVFAFGASASWRLQHVGQIHSLACFALTWWLLTRSVRTGAWLSGLGAGVAAGMMLVKPDQIAFLGAYVLAAYVLWTLLREGAPIAALRRTWPALLPAAIAGAAIVAAPLLLTMLFSQVSNRAEIEMAEAARGSLHPAFLLTAFIADLFGAADPKVDFWGPSSATWAPASLTLSQNMGQVYAGALPLLAVIGWLWQSLAGGGWRAIPGEGRFLLGAMLAMVIYALGAFTPLFPLVFEWLPGVDMFRRPADATFLIGALLALLSGHALSFWLSEGSAPLAVRRLPWLAGTVALVALIAGVTALAHGAWPVAWMAIARGVGWLAAGLAVLALCAAFASRGEASGRMAALAALLIGAFTAADLALNNGPNESTGVSPAIYAVMEPNTDNDTIAYLKAVLARSAREPGRRDRVELLGLAFHWPNLGMIHGFDHAFGYNPLHLAEFTEATGARDHMGTTQERSFTPLFPSFRSEFAALLGLRFIVSAAPIESIDKALRPGDMTLLARTRDGYIYENRRALPRAMFVGGWALADFEALRARGYPAGFDPRATVLLETAPEDLPSRARTAQAAQATVTLERYANTDVVIAVESAEPGLVLLNDVWHPWWTATVNGEEVDILKANGLFRAVQVEAGKSTVRFRFRPLDGAIAELRDTLLGEREETPALTALLP